MKNVYLLLILAFSTSLTYSQLSVEVSNESSQGACDGSAYLLDSWQLTSWEWADSVATVQNGGDSLANLCAGVYLINYMDSMGGSYSYTFIVESAVDPCNGLSASVQTTSVSGPNTCDGVAWTTVTGGNAPYTYQWSNGTTYYEMANLCVGTYTVSVVDANGCNASGTGIVEVDTNGVDCSTFVLSGSSTNETMAGDCDGSVELVATGGTSPYSYSWNNGLNSAYGDSICSGVYVISATDNNGCVSTFTVVVESDSSNTDPCNGFVIGGSVVNPSTPNTCDGTAFVEVSGGTSPYSYSWSNGVTTTANENLCPGTYVCQVVDANGCELSFTQMISSQGDSSSVLGAYPITTDESSDGACDGSVEIEIYGGIAPYSIQYGGNVGPDSLCAGMYEAIITDAGGNTSMVTYLISSPSNTVINDTYSDSTVVDTLIGNILDDCEIDFANVDSALINFYNILTSDQVEIVWVVYSGNGIVSTFTETYFIGGGNGVYSVELVINCEQKSTGDYLRVVDQFYFDNTTVSYEKMIGMEVNVFPNPFKGNVSLTFDNSDEKQISVYDMTGKLVNSSVTNAFQTNIDLNRLANGQYVLKVVSGNNIFTKMIIK